MGDEGPWELEELDGLAGKGVERARARGVVNKSQKSFHRGGLAALGALTDRD
jgi:hypothetical protein